MDSLAKQGAEATSLLIAIGSDYFAKLHEFAGIPMQKPEVLVEALRQYVKTRESGAAGPVPANLHELAVGKTREAVLAALGQPRANEFWAWIVLILGDERNWWGSQLAELASLDAETWRQLEQAAPLADDLHQAVESFIEQSGLLERRIETLRALPPTPWDEHLAQYYRETDSSPLDHLHGLLADQQWRRTWTDQVPDRPVDRVEELMKASRSVVAAPGFYDHRSALWAW
jgi:hypothetical protein